MRRDKGFMRMQYEMLEQLQRDSDNGKKPFSRNVEKISGKTVRFDRLASARWN